MLLKSRWSVLLAVAALPLAGCGSSTSGSGDAGADPAKVVPAGAPLYVEAVVRPDGTLKSGANDALKKLLRTDDPGQKLVDLFDKSAAKDKVSWNDLKQWLGPRVGIYVTKFGGAGTEGALIADTTDKDKAKAFLDQQVKNSSDGKTASAMVGDYAVLGSASGVKAVQAAAADGAKTLADSPDYQAARDAAHGADSLAVVYLEPQGLLDAVAQMSQGTSSSPFSDPKTLTVIRQLFAKAGRAAAVSLHADGGAVRVEGATIGAPAGSSTTAAADSLAALPADAWLGIGFGNIGKTLTDAIAQISQLASVARPGGPDFSKVFDSLQKRLGIDIRADFLSWMGDGAVYGRGHSLADIGGALTIKTTNPAKSRKAVGILAQALAKTGANVRPAQVDGYDIAVEVRSSSAPISLFIAANNERFTLGVNPQAMSDLIAPDQKLADSDTYKKASETLGGDVKPIVIVDTQTIIGLIESFGAGQSASYQKVKPYLDVLGPISAGTAHDGDVSRFALALGLR